MSTTRVRELMNSDVYTVNENDDVVSAEQSMRLQRIRHLPVLRGKRLAGLVTSRDLVRAQAQMYAALATNASDAKQVVPITAGQIMTVDYVTCNPETPADDAARAMLDKKVGCVLVVDDDALVGIVTESDVLQWAIEVMAKQRYEQ